MMTLIALAWWLPPALLILYTCVKELRSDETLVSGWWWKMVLGVLFAPWVVLYFFLKDHRIL